MTARDRIENEFDESLRDAVIGLREQRCTWDDIAEILEVSRWQLWHWRQEFSIEDNQRFYRKRAKIDIVARKLGYPNGQEAIRDMRWSEMTVEQVAERLGVHRRTVTRHYPPGLAGEIFVRTERYWSSRRKPGGNWAK